MEFSESGSDWLVHDKKDQSSHSDIYFNDKESVQQTSYILQFLWKDLTSLSSFYCKLMWIKASDWSSNNEWEKIYMLYTVLLCPSSKGLYSLERTITIMCNIFPLQSCQNYRITLVPEHAPLAVVLVLPPWFITVVSYKWGIGQKWS